MKRFLVSFSFFVSYFLVMVWKVFRHEKKKDATWQHDIDNRLGFCKVQDFLLLFADVSSLFSPLLKKIIIESLQPIVLPPPQEHLRQLRKNIALYDFVCQLPLERSLSRWFGCNQFLFETKINFIVTSVSKKVNNHWRWLEGREWMEDPRHFSMPSF